MLAKMSTIKIRTFTGHVRNHIIFEMNCDMVDIGDAPYVTFKKILYKNLIAIVSVIVKFLSPDFDIGWETVEKLID